MNRSKLFFILWFLCFTVKVAAQQQSEADLIGHIFKSLQYDDNKQFGDLFAGVDSLTQWVLQHADKNSSSYRKMEAIQNSPYYKLRFDSSIREACNKNFQTFIDKSKTLNINWSETIFIRYELDKIRGGRGIINEKIAPLRFLGYVFFKDQLTQKIYCFTVNDLMQVNGLWYGGELVNIFEAKNKEEYEKELLAEKKRKRMQALGLAVDDDKKEHASTDDEPENNKPSFLKQVAERRFYKGWFDNEIKVQLYVRYIKGSCPEGICSWEALFKFGDQDDYVKMDVTRTADGKWIFTEDVGGMELTLNGDIYTGTYSSNSDKTGYEVKFTQTPISPKKLKKLDEILESGDYGE